MARILIVDDEKDVHYSFRRMLAKEAELELLSAHSGEEAITFLEHTPDVDLVVMDIRMGGISGLGALKQIQSQDVRRKPLVIVMTAFSTADAAIEATKLGAFEYVLKPFNTDKMKSLIQEALYARQAMHRVVTLEESAGDPDDQDTDRIVGRHSSMHEVYKMIGRVASTDATVLIQGESGTGKELVARAIYHHSGRKEKVFLPLNCAAIPEPLLESELFGHERGAFTGAVERRIGKFEQCDGGTLFLDEIGDISPALQGKILRLLEDHSFQRLGGERWITTNVRILAATNKNLAKMVQEGKFREDLYYRLNVVSITLPPLRERREDIPALVHFFLRRYSSQYGKVKKGIDEEAMIQLQRYHWAGNVRQLENAIKRAIVISRGELLMPHDFHLPEEGVSSIPSKQPAPLDPADLTDDELLERISSHLEQVFRQLVRANPEKGMLSLIERKLVQRTIDYTQGNQVHAARLLGLSRNTLRARLKEQGLLKED